MIRDILELLTLDRYKLIAFALEYIVIFVAICADLFAGLRKAKKQNKIRTSFGFRKTLDKVLQYYGVTFFLTFVDLLQMYLISGLMQQMELKLFAFPIITLISTFYICIIEYKSISEKRTAKETARIDEVNKLLSSVLDDEKKKDEIDILLSTLKKIKDVK